MAHDYARSALQANRLRAAQRARKAAERLTSLAPRERGGLAAPTRSPLTNLLFRAVTARRDAALATPTPAPVSGPL